MLLLNGAGVRCLIAVFTEDVISPGFVTLCRWASGDALRKTVMTSSSWYLEDEGITTSGEVITIVETSGSIRPTTGRLTPEDSKPTRFNIQQFYVLPTQCIYEFCVGLRTNSDYFPIQN